MPRVNDGDRTDFRLRLNAMLVASRKLTVPVPVSVIMERLNQPDAQKITDVDKLRDYVLR